MSKSSIGKSDRNAVTLIAVLGQLVVPAFEEYAAGSTGDTSRVELIEPDPEVCNDPFVRAQLRGGRLVHVTAQPFDDAPTTLRLPPAAKHRFRRDLPTLERRPGTWLRNFNVAAGRPGFTIPGHLAALKNPEKPLRNESV